MYKTADHKNLGIALLSLLTGAGTYAGLRGYRAINETLNPVDPTPNQLDLTLPKSRVPKVAGFGEWIDNSADIAAPVAIGAAGLYGGFKGAQGIHSYMQNKELDEQREHVKQQYLAALQRAATKTASEEPSTPIIDNVINGFLDKKAEEFLQQKFNDFVGGIKNVGERTGNAVLGSDAAGYLGGGMMLTGGAAALATYYLANRLDKNKAEANNKSQIPTEVKLHVK